MRKFLLFLPMTIMSGALGCAAALLFEQPSWVALLRGLGRLVAEPVLARLLESSSALLLARADLWQSLSPIGVLPKLAAFLVISCPLTMLVLRWWSELGATVGQRATTAKTLPEAGRRPATHIEAARCGETADLPTWWMDVASRLQSGFPFAEQEQGVRRDARRSSSAS